MLRAQLLFAVVLALLPLNGASTADEKQDKAIKAIAEFYRTHGEADLAKKLTEGYANKKVVFGKPAGGDNAHFDHWSKVMTIHTDMPGTLSDSVTGDRFKAHAGAALTIAHEFEHARQSYISWHASVASQRLKRGNGCEQDAWGAQFSLNAEWIRNKKRELDQLRSKGASAREIGAKAAELKALADTWVTYTNDYKTIQKTIGKVKIADPTDTTTDGFPADPKSLDELVKGVNELIKEAEGEMRIAGILATPFDGTYRGDFNGDRINGELSFSIVGIEVRGKLNGQTTTGKIDARIEGKINRDGILDLKFRDGTIMWEEDKGVPFIGKASGSLVKGEVTNGEWTAMSPNVDEEGRRLHLDKGHWKAKKR